MVHEARMTFVVLCMAICACTNQSETLSGNDSFGNGQKADHAELTELYQPISLCGEVSGTLSAANRWDGWAFHVDHYSPEVVITMSPAYFSHMELYKVDPNEELGLRSVNRVATGADCYGLSCLSLALEAGDYVIVATTPQHIEARSGNGDNFADEGFALEYTLSLERFNESGQCTAEGCGDRLDLKYQNPVACTNLADPSEGITFFENECGCGVRCFPSATQPGVSYRPITEEDPCYYSYSWVIETATISITQENACGCVTIDDVEAYCTRSMDANGVGECLGDAASLGWKRNNRTCEEVVGCSCEGADCGDLYPSESDCQADAWVNNCDNFNH